MISTLALGLGMFMLSLCILAIPTAVLIAMITGKYASQITHPSFLANLAVMQITGLLVAMAHLANIGLWAALLRVCGEFKSYEAAYYHSAVNYSSLGYGDMVMSPRWRLLGPLETLDGIVIVGISTALMFALMARLFERRLKAKEQKNEPVA